MDFIRIKCKYRGKMSLEKLQSMCTGPFAVNGEAIRRKRQDISTVRKRALCAMIHNNLQKISVFANLKKQQKRGDKKFECGCCNQIVPQLENAHVGETLGEMVDKLMAEYPEESIEKIFYRLLDIHEAPDKLYVVCCKSCNKKLDGFVLNQKLDGSGTDHPTHTEQPLVVVPCGPVKDLLGVGVNNQG